MQWKMSLAKGMVREVLEQVIMAAAIVKLAARMVSAAAGWYNDDPEAADQPAACANDLLYHLRMLIIMLRCTVEEAERVHIRRRWLREWLSELRDAAVDGDEVLQRCGQRLAARQLASASGVVGSAGNTSSVIKRILVRLFFSRRVDHDALRLSRTVAMLDKVYASYIADFLTLLQCSVTPPPVTAIQDDRGDDDDDDDDDGGGSSSSDDDDDSDDGNNHGRRRRRLAPDHLDEGPWTSSRVDDQVPKSMGLSSKLIPLFQNTICFTFLTSNFTIYLIQKIYYNLLYYFKKKSNKI